MGGKISEITQHLIQQFKINFVNRKIKQLWKNYLKRKINWYENRPRYILSMVCNTMMKPMSSYQKFYIPLKIFFDLILD